MLGYSALLHASRNAVENCDPVHNTLETRFWLPFSAEKSILHFDNAFSEEVDGMSGNNLVVDKQTSVGTLDGNSDIDLLMLVYRLWSNQKEILTGSKVKFFQRTI